MRCPSCAEAALVRDTRDMPYTYKGESTTIADVEGDFCPACGEAVLSASESTRVSTAMLEFNRQVNASIVDPKFIANVRHKLALERTGIHPPIGAAEYARKDVRHSRASP